MELFDVILAPTVQQHPLDISRNRGGEYLDRLRQHWIFNQNEWLDNGLNSLAFRLDDDLGLQIASPLPGQNERSMSSYSIPGTQRPPFRTGSSSSIGISRRASSQHLHQAPRSSPLRVSTESVYGPPTSPLGAIEPAAKRQKVGDGQQDIVENGQEEVSPLSSLLEQPNRHLEQKELLLADSSIQWPTTPLAPFPSRPAQTSSRRTESASTERSFLPRESVQAKPYTLDIPKTAPRYQNGGKWYLPTSIWI